MNSSSDEVRMVHTATGRWIAISPPSTGMEIGVEGDTVEEAQAALAAALDHWRAIGERPDPGYVS